MTLEEIGRRAVALTEAYDPSEGPCHVDMEDDPEDWCAPCKAHAEQVKARQKASRRLSRAIQTYRAQRMRGLSG